MRNGRKLLGGLVVLTMLPAAFGQPGGGFDPRLRIGDTVTADYQSPHPHGPGNDWGIVWSQTVQHDAATFVRIHFADDTEVGDGDLIVVRDATGRITREYSDTDAADRWTPTMEGDTAVVELWADDENEGFGVVIDELAVGTYPLFGESAAAGGGITSICNATDPSRIRAADPVTRLTWVDQCGGAFLCSGWLFSPQGHMMTNAHCANSQSEANNLECWFNYVPTACDLPLPIPNPDVFDDAITFVVKDCDRDFAVHKVFDPVKGNPADRYGYLAINPIVPADGTELWLPQHPGGIRKQIAENCHVNDSSEAGFNGCADPPAGCGNQGFSVGVVDLSFDCGIEQGSSGSPVLNTNDEVVAIAHAGNEIENFGVRMFNVVPLLPNPPLELHVNGPTQVNEGESASLTAVADYLFGTSHTVTNFVTWSVNPPTAGMVGPGGLFTADFVNGDTPVTVNGSYTQEGETVQGVLLLSVVDLGVDTPILDVSLLPSANPNSLTPGQSFFVDVRVGTDEDDVNEIRLIQIDTSLSSGVTIDSIEWGAGNSILAPGTTVYQFFDAGNVHSAFYPLTSPIPGFIVNFSSTSQPVARVHLTFLSNGQLNLFGSATPPTVDESVRFLSGFDQITEFSQAFFNVSNGSIALTTGVGQPVIVSSNPPDGAIDARQPSSVDGTDPVGWQMVDVTFSGNVENLTADDFTVTQQGGALSPPSVVSTAPLAADTLRLVLSSRIEPGARTTITHDATGSHVRLGFLPSDVNGDAFNAPPDVLALIDSLNGIGAPRPIWSTDINRSGLTEPSDILREIDLLNGAGAFDVWNGESLP